MRRIETLPIYRMTHIDNIPFIVKNGLWSKLSGVQDPNFVPIGNPGIIDRRTNTQIGLSIPSGVLGEFIPFYFAGHSPMLLNIATGHGVSCIPQNRIVFIECDAIQIINEGIPFCFTDGNAASSITRFFNNLVNLVELDWQTIKSTYWKNDDTDFDRSRKKMSEFLVKDHIPSRLIKSIIVRNGESAQLVRSMKGESLPNCSIIVDNNNIFYFRKYA